MEIKLIYFRVLIVVLIVSNFWVLCTMELPLSVIGSFMINFSMNCEKIIYLYYEIIIDHYLLTIIQEYL